MAADTTVVDGAGKGAALSLSAREGFVPAAHAAMDDFWREFCELYRDIAASFGLSESAWDILYVILMAEGDGGVSQRRICDEMCLGKQTVNSSVHKLSREGIVSVERAGRESIVRLTEEGRALAARAVEPVVEAEKVALADMGEQACSQMLALSRRFACVLRRRFSEVPGSRVCAPAGSGEGR